MLRGSRTLVCWAILAALVFAGCGGDDEPEVNTSAAAPDAGATGATGAQDTDADGDGLSTPAGSGLVPLDGPPDPDLSVNEVVQQLPLPDAVSTEPGVAETVDIFIAASHKYFAESLDLLDEPYHLPELVAYDGASGDEGPDCGGGQHAGVENAAYCNGPGTPEEGIIAWDETGLIEPLYTEIGDGAVMFILGHEFAHLTQDRLGILTQFPLTVEKELQADCLTGAYMGDFDSAGVNFSEADANSILSGISIVGDAPGTKWQDAHAHGSGEQRQQVFLEGFDKGFEYCITEYAPGFSS